MSSTTETGISPAAADCTAKAALGRRLLVERGKGREAIALITEAANEGSGEAAHLLAVLASAGIGMKPDWGMALDHLRRSAELGFQVARTELGVLAGDRRVAAHIEKGREFPPGRWKVLRDSVDLAKWFRPPNARRISDTPRLIALEGFASASVCDWLIARARPLLRAAQTDDPESGQPVYANSRTNSSAGFELPDTDVVIHLLRARIAAATGFPPAAMEGSVVLHYRPGEEFFPHFDFFDTASAGYAREVGQHGQRALTLLVYLNDSYEGGETDFPLIGVRHKGRRGDALFFWNVHPTGQPDRKTLHAGLPTTTGEKWLFSQWIRHRG